MTETEDSTFEEKGVTYEKVTVNVLKLVMDYLRKTENDAVVTLEHAIVDHVRAEMEGMSGLEYIEVFGLKPVFYPVLGDERFKEE